jgi:hypothetical protein
VLSRDVGHHDEAGMEFEVTNELAEVVCVVRHAHAVIIDAEPEDLRVGHAEQVPVSGAGGVVAVVVCDGNEPG